MKGKHKGFIWETKRRNDLELPDESNTKIYELVVSSEESDWLYIDEWTCKNGIYNSTETTKTDTSQKRFAEDIINRFVLNDYERTKRNNLLKEELDKIMD